MKCHWLIASTLCLSSCLCNNALEYSAVADNNLYHLTKVRKGMGEREVLQIMRQPYKYETFELGEDVYDVWFYVTQTTALAQSHMVPLNLTPLSFRNGILAGTGYDYYYFIVRQQAKLDEENMPPKPAPPAPPPIREPQTAKPAQSENTDLEKNLKEAVQPNQKRPPRTEQKGNLQKTPQPTAPILSKQPKKLTSLLGVKNPFSKVKKGMSEDQVKNILGQPADSQTFQLGDDVYDVFFYDTTGKENVPMTPLTFKNSVLVGMTNEYYEGIKQAAGDHVNGYNRKGEQMEEGERQQDFEYW